MTRAPDRENRTPGMRWATRNPTTTARTMAMPAHGGGPGLGDVDLRAVLADLLADVVLDQPPDQHRGGQHGHPQGDAARGHQRDHRSAPRPAVGQRRPGHRPGRRRAGAGRPPPGWSRGPCRPPPPRRRVGRGRPPGRWRRRRSGSTTSSAALAGTPARTWSMMAAGSSDRGLSEVRTATSASRPGHLAHQRALGRVPVAPAAEHAHHPAVAGQTPGRGQGHVQAGRGVGVVDQDGEAAGRR